MSSVNRKIKRTKQKKAKKKAKKGLKDALNATAGIPANCTQCEKEFDLKTDADTWVVDIKPGRIQLLCPNCIKEFDSLNI